MPTPERADADTDAARQLQALQERVRHLEELLADAERRVRARDDLLVVAAHELRTPMNSLSLQLAAAERRARDGDGARVLHDVVRARALLARYVKRATVLLDVARLNSGQFAIERTPCDLAQLVADAVEAHADELRFHRMDVNVSVPPGLVGRWDPRAIDQVLSNLLSNAVKYASGAPVEVRAWREAGSIVLTVADGGPGIAAADRHRIFEKFERAVGGPALRAGFGLGLWIVRQLVEAHGGRIDVETPASGGSVFRIRLPAAAEGTAAT